MRLVLFLAALGSLLASAPAWAADYWPLTKAALYHFTNDQGLAVDMYFDGGGGRSDHYNYNYAECFEWNQYSLSPAGDVLLETMDFFCVGSIDPEELWFYYPPSTFLDLPLEVGKSWTAVDPAGYGVCARHVSYQLVSEQTVTVPAGTFQTMVLVESNLHGQRVYYLDRELGPVMMDAYCQSSLDQRLKLIRVEEQTPARSETWGALKARYR
jgi:hypothetical protein